MFLPDFPYPKNAGSSTVHTTVAQQYLVFRRNLLHTSGRSVDVLAQPPQARFTHNFHRKASPRGFADPPLAQLDAAEGAATELSQQHILVHGLLALRILAPPDIGCELAIPLPIRRLVDLLVSAGTRASGEAGGSGGGSGRDRGAALYGASAIGEGGAWEKGRTVNVEIMCSVFSATRTSAACGYPSW